MLNNVGATVATVMRMTMNENGLFRCDDGACTAARTVHDVRVAATTEA
jgi:hypothetical protein